MGEKMLHFYEKLPGWASFGELYVAMVQRAPQEGASFVEVGSWLGRSAALMAVEIINSGKSIKFACVDPWEDGGPDLRDTNYYKDLPNPVYDTFLHNVSPVRHVIATLRMQSTTAALHFGNESVDFLMLDGDHSYEAVHDDIEAWLPKMKPGGVIAGDDYLWPGVKQAADDAFGPRLKSVVKKQHRDYKQSVAYWWTQL
jgi:predicted O-methyltransferase YrrM